MASTGSRSLPAGPRGPKGERGGGRERDLPRPKRDRQACRQLHELPEPRGRVTVADRRPWRGAGTLTSCSRRAYAPPAGPALQAPGPLISLSLRFSLAADQFNCSVATCAAEVALSLSLTEPDGSVLAKDQEPGEERGRTGRPKQTCGGPLFAETGCERPFVSRALEAPAPHAPRDSEEPRALAASNPSPAPPRPRPRSCLAAPRLPLPRQTAARLSPGSPRRDLLVQRLRCGTRPSRPGAFRSLPSSGRATRAPEA